MRSDAWEFIAEDLIKNSAVLVIPNELTIFVLVFPWVFQIQHEQPKTFEIIINHYLSWFEIPVYYISFVDFFQHTKLLK